MAGRAESTQSSKAVHEAGYKHRRGTFGDDHIGDDLLGRRTREIARFPGREWQDRDDVPETQTQPGPKSPERTAGMPRWRK